MLPEYQAAPDVTRERMYFDTMQEVMSGTSKVLIDAKNSGNLMYLPLDKLMQNSQSNKSVSTKSKPAQPIMSVNSTTNNSSMPLDGRPSRGDRTGRN